MRVRTYPIKTPRLAEWLYPSLTWRIPSSRKEIYLTFDDGPHPEVTGWVLDELKKYDARGTFFCVGGNVIAHPEMYKRITQEGHATGNHSHNHLNGWKTNEAEYIKNVSEAGKYISSRLFRPPYGRLKPGQRKILAAKYRIIMWSLLSGDFDPDLNIAISLNTIRMKGRPGSIIVFHDSEKAFKNLKQLLPEVLMYFHRKGYRFKPLPE